MTLREKELVLNKVSFITLKKKIEKIRKTLGINVEHPKQRKSFENTCVLEYEDICLYRSHDRGYTTGKGSYRSSVCS